MRTLTWDPKQKVLRLIDQRALPAHLEFVECHHLAEVADAIRLMIVRGAPAIGVTAAFGMAIAGWN
ncbi:MAG TPA: S-methyl-5-thioribose-1-phosphate isomerase, partial [Anaerolineaceae bacterium]|nr:S-methyl-5-thioribose-1-phosphate isomerase [Anaerolineaceae bacterium]HQJ04063.1 S-methyl-5-thioribose-1-phosphate isomerase [Anaerolineaceae bacterium]